jgi:hypothetical protein
MSAGEICREHACRYKAAPVAEPVRTMAAKPSVFLPCAVFAPVCVCLLWLLSAWSRNAIACAIAAAATSDNGSAIRAAALIAFCNALHDE